jgi:hypothetical protein
MSLGYKEDVKSIDFDSSIFTPYLSADPSNFELTLLLRIFLKQVNPAAGKSTFQAEDYNGNLWPALRWNSASWLHFKKEYVQQVYATWHDAFTLIPPLSCDVFVFPQDRTGTRRNVRCRLGIKLLDDEHHAHAVINIVRLATGTKTYFRSSSDSYGWAEGQKPVRMHDAKEGVSWEKHTFAHEVGHLLGLQHPNEYSEECASSPGSHACYGSNLAQYMDVMGAGGELSLEDAKPWLDRMHEHVPDTRRADWKVTWTTPDVMLRGLESLEIDPDRRPPYKPPQPGLIDL